VAYACDQGHYGGMEKCAACDGTGQMTEPTPRTVFIRGIELPLDLNHYPADSAEGWEMLCRAKYAIESLERQCARKEALLRDCIDHLLPGVLLERIERELKG
jgi:hypothetical protein